MMGFFPLCHHVHASCGANPASYPVGTGDSQGMKLTTHLHLVPRLRMYGVVLPIPQYIFVAWYLLKHREYLTFTFVP